MNLACIGQNRQIVWLEQCYRSQEKIEKMEALAKKLALPADDIRYMYDTFAILARISHELFDFKLN